MIDLLIDSKVIHDVGLVIFDKDGTLIELYHYWSQMVVLRARLICEALGLGQEHEAGLRWALGVDEKAGRLRPEGPVGLKKREVVIKAARIISAGSAAETRCGSASRPSSAPTRSRAVSLPDSSGRSGGRCP